MKFLLFACRPWTKMLWVWFWSIRAAIRITVFLCFCQILVKIHVCVPVCSAEERQLNWEGCVSHNRDEPWAYRKMTLLPITYALYKWSTGKDSIHVTKKFQVLNSVFKDICFFQLRVTCYLKSIRNLTYPDIRVLPRDPSFPTIYSSCHSTPCSFSRVSFSP